ncbi:MAG: GTP-binding protein [Alphaproteobacteria bacterium]|nr:GTP-binding protein [Alphaproteobacteria bacterium]
MSEVHVPDQANRLPISVLTGFLGSGKTTLLSKLLRDPDMANTAVVINEFGDVGLDHMLVESSDEDTILMDSGCLCCTIRGDLVDTLRGLFRKRVMGDVPEFERLVIETTGLADPAPILHTLMNDPLICARYRLDGVLTTVDAVHGLGQLDTQFESVKQAAVADRILITKADMVEPDDIEALQTRLRGINPAAPMHIVSHGEIAAKHVLNVGLFDPTGKIPDVEKWLREESYESPQEGEGHNHDGHDHHGEGHHHNDANRHDDHIRTFCLTADEPFSWDAFANWMDALTSVHGESLLRVKGVLHVTDTDQPVVVHGVQHVFHPPAVLEAWPNEDRRSRIVMITRDLNKEPVEKMFRAFIES